MRVLSFIIISAMFWGCKHNTETFDGPDLNDLYGEFYLVSDLQLSAKSIDFAGGETLVFNAELSKRTAWSIEIIGENSGAVSTINGSSRVLSSETATWKGGANTFPGFGVEKAFVKITFPNEENSPVLRDTISLLSPKIDDGFLITGFETGRGETWQSFNQTTVAAGIVCGDNNAAKGDCYYSFEGVVGWDWAIASVMVKPDDNTTFGLPNNPNNLFFNVGLKPVESVGPQSSFFLIWFDEDENGDGVFDPTTEDRYVYEYWTENSNWKVLSVKYADLQFDAEGNNVEVFGNGLPEPSKLHAINVFYLSNPENGNAKAFVDHMIFTLNETYKP